ncbi:MAG: pyrroline-5-carboxylate reductase [Pseudomonadota bacterium]
MTSRSIALIGAGRMGGALARGWAASTGFSELSLIEPAPGPAAQAMAETPGVRLNPDAHPADIVVVAVKPQIFADAASGICSWIGPDSLVLSIMAGVRLRTLARLLGTDRVVRAMPNTPGAIGRGVSVVCAPRAAPREDIEAARALLAPLGVVEGPVDEALMPAITAISGSGPAYAFLLAEALAAAGEAEGLTADLAARIAAATVSGAGALMAESNEAPDALRRAVTSPGGTTEAALAVLMDENGLPSLLRKAVRAAADRERALSGDGE